MIARRSFLAGILAAGAAPAIVRASSVMKLWVPPEPVWEFFSTSFTCDVSLPLSGDGWVYELLAPAGHTVWSAGIARYERQTQRETNAKVRLALRDLMTGSGK